MATRLDRGALLAGAMLVMMLVLGVVGGVALDRWALRPARAVAAGRGAFDPARYRSRMADALTRDLHLTTQQRVRVDSLLHEGQREAAAVTREMRPRLDSVTARTRAGLREILTPAQWEQWQRQRPARGPRGRNQGS